MPRNNSDNNGRGKGAAAASARREITTTRRNTRRRGSGSRRNTNNGDDLVTSDYLKGAQFNFSVLTHSNLESEKLTYYVFDYGLQKMGTNKFKVIKYEK